MMANGGMEEWLHSFSNLVHYRTQLSASCPSCFTPSTQTLPVKEKKKKKKKKEEEEEEGKKKEVKVFPLQAWCGPEGG